MTKTLSNRDICYIKAVLLMCKINIEKEREIERSKKGDIRKKKMIILNDYFILCILFRVYINNQKYRCCLKFKDKLLLIAQFYALLIHFSGFLWSICIYIYIRTCNFSYSVLLYQFNTQHESL